jgi:hypothetical protein
MLVSLNVNVPGAGELAAVTVALMATDCPNNPETGTKVGVPTVSAACAAGEVMFCPNDVEPLKLLLAGV